MAQRKTLPLALRWTIVLRYADLPVNVKGFGALLATWADADGTNCYPGIARPLVPMGYAKRTVQDYLRQLEKAGWLKVEHGGGRLPDGSYSHNRYTLTIPAGAEPAPLGLVTVQAGTGNGADPDAVTVQGEHHDLSLDISKDLPALNFDKVKNDLKAIGVDLGEKAA